MGCEKGEEGGEERGGERRGYVPPERKFLSPPLVTNN